MRKLLGILLLIPAFPFGLLGAWLGVKWMEQPFHYAWWLIGGYDE
jgi:hypothetical protein